MHAVVGLVILHNFTIITRQFAVLVVFLERTMSQGFDKYSDSVGHLVMKEDGAITNVRLFSAVNNNNNTMPIYFSP